MTDAAASVNRYQKGWGHPLTCGNCRPPERDERPLVAHMDGDLVVLTCPMCDYRQVMADDLLGIVVKMSDRVALDPFVSSDINRISSVEFVRRQPMMFLGPLGPDTTLSADVIRRLRDALSRLVPGSPVSVDVFDGWTMLHCPVDWLDPLPSGRNPFLELVPFPEWAPNSYRPEVLVTAFAEVAVTAASGGDWTVVAGDDADISRSTRSRLAELLDRGGRVVAFR